MAPDPLPRDAAAARLENFLCAGIADLCRLARLPDLRDFCPACQYSKQAGKAIAVPATLALAQLAIYLLLMTRGLQSQHTTLFPRRERLRNLLQRIYRKSEKAWDDGTSSDLRELQPVVRTLAVFARRNIPGFEGQVDGLEAFGVKSVQRSLMILTERLAMATAEKIAKSPGKVSDELVAASLVASATSPGGIERIGKGHTVKGLMRFAVRAGLAGDRSKKRGEKAEAPNEPRRFLKRAKKVLDQ